MPGLEDMTEMELVGELVKKLRGGVYNSRLDKVVVLGECVRCGRETPRWDRFSCYWCQPWGGAEGPSWKPEGWADASP